MKLVVPYGIRLEADGKIGVVPVAHVRIQSKDRTREAPGIFVIDSGAATSLLPRDDADALGLNVEAGQKISVQGVTGHQLLGYRHNVVLVIEGFILQDVPVIFAVTTNVPRVLGREGIFAEFGILFDESRRRVIFLDSDKERRVIDSVFK